jgi:vitamin B12/bleomycin/antimicrobial peptide transport system ATP-binding/permease protein
MDHQVDSHRLTAKRFWRAIRLFATGEDGRKVRWMFAALIAFLFAINGTSVVNSYVGRDFMTAIADRDTHGFIVQALLYLVVFAVATVLAVMSHFTEERLALLWRTHLTGRAIRSYLAEATYYRVEAANSLDNPDQRIAEDIRTFTVTTLSFVLMLLNSIFTVVAFSGVLWSISPLLFLVAVLYAAGGSLLTILLGRPLVKLNYDQFDKEANFRADLIHVREHAEAIRLAEGEDRLAERLLGRLSAVVGNFQRIIAINRNLGFFTTGYNWLIQIIPVLIVAPAFIAHEIEFGVVTQSSMAFMTLVAAFSLIVTQFQSISSFAAVVARLESLIVAIERSQGMAEFAIEFREDKERLAYDGLTLRSPDDGRTLIRELSVSIPQGTRALIRAADGAATLALLRATADLAVSGEGVLIRPAAADLKFLTERPYLPPGTLRAAVVPAGMDGSITDAHLLTLFTDWGLETVLSRADGLDTERDWAGLLSLGEQQLLACLRVVLAGPRFVLLHRVGTALGRERVGIVLDRLAQAGITSIHLGRSTDPDGPYDTVVDIHADGRWTRSDATA